MNAVHVGAATVSLAMLAGCASDWERSYWRWYHYKADFGPYFQWAMCVDQRSAHYVAPADMGPVAPTGAGNRSQTFARVLEDCREHMAGPAWDNLADDQIERMILDAYQAFVGAEAEAMARYEASIISTGSQN